MSEWSPALLAVVANYVLGLLAAVAVRRGHEALLQHWVERVYMAALAGAGLVTFGLFLSGSGTGPGITAAFGLALMVLIAVWEVGPRRSAAGF